VAGIYNEYNTDSFSGTFERLRVSYERPNALAWHGSYER
jgi:hypothetical protein